MLTNILENMSDRHIEAWKHRCAGLTYGRIARKMDISRQRVHQMIGEIDNVVHAEAIRKLKVLTTKDVSDILHCAREMVIKLIRIGELKSFKLTDGVNSSIRIRQVDLQHYIDSRVDKENPADDIDGLFTVRQVAEVLSLTNASIYTMISEGKIGYVSVSNKKGIRIPAKSLEEWINKNYQESK